MPTHRPTSFAATGHDRTRRSRAPPRRLFCCTLDCRTTFLVLPAGGVTRWSDALLDRYRPASRCSKETDLPALAPERTFRALCHDRNPAPGAHLLTAPERHSGVKNPPPQADSRNTWQTCCPSALAPLCGVSSPGPIRDAIRVRAARARCPRVTAACLPTSPRPRPGLV